MCFNHCSPHWGMSPFSGTGTHAMPAKPLLQGLCPHKMNDRGREPPLSGETAFPGDDDEMSGNPRDFFGGEIDAMDIKAAGASKPHCCCQYKSLGLMKMWVEGVLPWPWVWNGKGNGGGKGEQGGKGGGHASSM